MAIRADRDPKYYFRFWLIGLFATGFALWFLYDGAVTYPDQRERGLAFDKHMEENRGNEWDAYARERGWSTESPGEPKSETDIQMQYIMAAAAGIVGVAVLLGVLRSRGRWIESDVNGITSSWGQTVPFDRVVSIDKRKWRNKGIAKIRYEDGNRKRTFVLDDFKFKRDPTDAILRQLEERVGIEKVTGGPPEADKQAPAEQDAAI